MPAAFWLSVVSLYLHLLLFFPVLSGRDRLIAFEYPVKGHRADKANPLCDLIDLHGGILHQQFLGRIHPVLVEIILEGGLQMLPDQLAHISL